MNKLFYAVFLFLALSAVTFPALADSEREQKEAVIHQMFAQYSDQELSDLLFFVQYELVSRGFVIQDVGDHSKAVKKEDVTVQKEVTVPPGTYSVGSDIPAGTYTVTTKGIITMLTVKNSAGGLVTMHSLNGNTQVGKLVLEDGQTVELVGESVIFKPYQGLGF